MNSTLKSQLVARDESNRSSLLLPSADARFWKLWNCAFNPREQNANEKAENPVYLQNCHKAAAYFIDEYLRPEGKRPSFENMLKTMHVLMIKGLTSTPSGTYNPEDKFPDKFRSEIDMDFSNDGVLANISPVSKSFRKLIQEPRGMTAVGEPFTLAVEFVRPKYKMNLHLVLNAHNQYAFGVKTKHFDWRQIVTIQGEEFSCKVIPPAKIAASLQAAEEYLHQILAHDPFASRQPESKRAELFELAARYYQLMLMTHPFLSQGNSMTINQLNCILFLFAGKFVTHAFYKLDMKAYSMPPDDFVEIFRVIMAELPEIPVPVFA